eukprot:COSAG06_NODE_1257_length_10084_cov_3.046770_3_plen_93_part_00
MSCRDSFNYVWCAAVAAAAGVRLLRLSFIRSKVTLRRLPAPHTWRPRRPPQQLLQPLLLQLLLLIVAKVAMVVVVAAAVVLQQLHLLLYRYG